MMEMLSHPYTAHHRPIYDRTYPPLRRFSFPWRIVASWVSAIFWLCSTPWLVVRYVAPNNLQDNLEDIERSYLDIATPIVTFVQDTAYKVVNIADVTTDWTLNTAAHIYHNNLKGMERTLDWVLTQVEHRLRILKDEGLNGIMKALSYDVFIPEDRHRKATGFMATGPMAPGKLA